MTTMTTYVTYDQLTPAQREQIARRLATNINPAYTLETAYYLNGDVKGGDRSELLLADDGAAQVFLTAVLQHHHKWYDVIEYKLTAQADGRVIAEGESRGTPTLPR